MATLYQAFNPSFRWPSLAGWFYGTHARRHRGSAIDLRDMPDHILRDIGALDGNDPTGRRA